MKRFTKEEIFELRAALTARLRVLRATAADHASEAAQGSPGAKLAIRNSEDRQRVVTALIVKFSL